jgi:hypothetical protein
VISEPGRATKEADVARSKDNSDFGIGPLQPAYVKNGIVAQRHGENRCAGFFLVHVAM